MFDFESFCGNDLLRSL